jgi:hypothetical protein
MEDLLDVTNYRDHPTDQDFIVFHLKRPDQAGFFEYLLVEHLVEFERFDDFTPKGKLYLFGVRRGHFKQVEKLNNITIGHYREKFIPGSGLRWFTVVFGLLVTLLAIIGFLKSQ